MHTDPNSPSALSRDERLTIEQANREMEGLGLQITTIHQELGASGRWQAHWRSKDRRLAIHAAAAAVDPLAP